MKVTADRLLTEIRKDIWFFGICGVLVGVLTIWHFRLSRLGIPQGEPWPNALFSDFISFHAFGLIFIGLLAAGAAATTFKSLGFRWRFLDQIVGHLELRLAQLVSVIVSFSVGVAVAALCHSVATQTSDGLTLTAMIMYLHALLFVGYFSSSMVARPIQPFDRWWAALAMLVFAAGLFMWLTIRGTGIDGS